METVLNWGYDIEGVLHGMKDLFFIYNVFFKK